MWLMRCVDDVIVWCALKRLRLVHSSLYAMRDWNTLTAMKKVRPELEKKRTTTGRRVRYMMKADRREKHTESPKRNAICVVR
mmetsp:Transcript_3916/g.8870  ORF Transcript_3916/g.8870 Transcript_3916/m.8870 type:complete len:82 (-) Transcript_3916:136-381(-)